MSDVFNIRDGRIEDAETIARFNIAMAEETEGRALDEAVAMAGARGPFDDPARGFYLVAEHNARVVACLMVTSEWSDWRDGYF